MHKTSKVFVAGVDTMIGRSLVRELYRLGYENVLSSEPRLTDHAEVDRFFATEKPEYVFFAAGKSGGIAANQKYPAGLMLDNLLTQTNVLSAAHDYGTTKTLFLASSCSYPRQAAQPMRVESLFTGPLEPTNQAYAVAKLSGIVLCQALRQQYRDNFIVGIPANAFGPDDEFNLEDSHVIAGLLMKLHDAKLQGSPAVEIWGTGAARREFIFVDDLASACVFAMNEYDGDEPINLGGGDDVSIKELAGIIKALVGYEGKLVFDSAKPDGMPLKSLDSSALQQLGWRPQRTLREGLELTYAWFLNNRNERMSPLELAHVR